MQVVLKLDHTMKILTVLLISVMFVGSVFFENSYAATVAYPTSDPSLPEISMQVVVRNNEGQLIAYFEPTLWYIADLSGLHKFLDAKEKIPLIKEGKQLELIQFDQIFYHNKDSEQITSEPLYYNNHAVLSPRHDGIIIKPGNTITVSWKIIRSIE